MTRKRLTVHDIGKPFYVSDRATVTKNPDDVRFYAGRAGSNDLFYAGSTEGIFEADLIEWGNWEPCNKEIRASRKHFCSPEVQDIGKLFWVSDTGQNQIDYVIANGNVKKTRMFIGLLEGRRAFLHGSGIGGTKRNSLTTWNYWREYDPGNQ